MKSAFRKFGIPCVLSLIGSAIGVFLYLLPAPVFPSANRVADYSMINDAFGYASSSGVFDTLHIPVVDLDAINSNIALVKIDEQSLGDTKSGLGAFPFPRSVYGRLLEKLHAAGAKVVVFDIDFPDPATDPAQDIAFANGLRAQATVLPITVNTTRSGLLGVEQLDPALSPYVANRGYTTVDTPGGVLLSQPFTIDTKTQHFVSFAEATIEQFTGKQVVSLSPNRGRFGSETVPLDDDKFYLLPFNLHTAQDIHIRVGAEDSWPKFVTAISMDDAVIEPVADLSTLAKGKIVVVGATAQALGDMALTPFGRIPGVFVNMRFMDQLLTHKFITPAPHAVDISLIFILPLLLTFLVMQSRATLGIALCVLATLMYMAFAVTIYAITLEWINVIHVAESMLLVTLFVSIYRVTREGSERRMVTNLFGMHVSPAIVSDILSQEDPSGALGLKGKRVKATIFYSDIRGFTAMSETMTPEEIYTQLNEYFEEMCNIIFKYGGYVDKFIGDCVMAVFSAPYPTPQDAENATRAAVEQQKKILELSEKWKAMGKREFTVGMGINTGEVVMGNLGASSRMNYTVIGDNVNVAARLYNVAIGGEIIISESTYDEVKDFVVAEERAPVAVKGKTQPIRIYNIVDVKPATTDVNPA